MSCDKALAYLSDNLLTVAGSFGPTGTPLTGMTDGITGVAVTTATITADLFDLAGTQLTGITLPVSLPHVGTPDGTYRGNIGDGLSASTSPGQTIKIKLDIDDGANRKHSPVLWVTVEEPT